MLEGHCNCGSITVSLATQSPQPGICYWYGTAHSRMQSRHGTLTPTSSNCQRAGSGLCSVIYAVPKSEVEIKDPDSVLRNYIDNNTKSGRALTRQFCGSCGRYVSISGVVHVPLLNGIAPLRP